jgi:hypothetical protein
LGISGFLVAVRWLIKSFIVKYLCDSGSGWGFKTAASVTGYAYFATLILSIPGIVIMWLFVPSITIDVTNTAIVQQQLASYVGQLSWLQWVYGLPTTLLGLVWKSYLGGLGAHFGADGCSVQKGVAVFFILGLVSALLSFAIS